MYEPDHRNRYHQRYCSQPDCRRASKAASQRHWLASPNGRDYFRDKIHTQRVRDWRKAHPGYWRKRRKPPRALQDHCSPQATAPAEDTSILGPRALQDIIHTQSLMLTGLVVQLTGSALQENIALATRRLILLGRQVQGPNAPRPSDARDQTSPLVHRVVSLLKRWLLGTHQGAVRAEHLDYYLDESTFRFNRRKSAYRGKLFYRLAQQAVQIEPVT